MYLVPTFIRIGIGIELPFGLGTGFGIGVELPLSELELNCKNGIDPSSVSDDSWDHVNFKAHFRYSTRNVRFWYTRNGHF